MGNGIQRLRPLSCHLHLHLRVCTLLFTHAPLGDWLTISVTFLVCDSVSRMRGGVRYSLIMVTLRHTGRTLDLIPLSAYALTGSHVRSVE